MRADDLIPECPECRAPMVDRKRARDGNTFYGCTKYPTCTGTRTWDDGQEWILVHVIGECPDPEDGGMRWDQ